MSSHGPGSEMSGGPPIEGTSDRVDSYEELATVLQNEAERLFSQGHYGDAEQKVRQLLDLQSQVVGQQHADFALGLSMLGELRYLQGDRIAAEDLFRRSLAIRERVLGRSHPDYAVSLICLSGMLWRRDALDEAERCLREALAIRSEALGAEHPESIQARKELVRMLRQRGDWAGAQALLQPFLDQAEFPSAPVMGRDLSEAVVALSSQFKTLGERLALTADLMRSIGAPPHRDCVRDLLACREQFATLQGEAVDRIEALRIPNPPTIELGTLQDLASVLDDLADAELHQLEKELLRTHALTVLDRVLSLIHGRHADFAPLRECQAHVRKLRETIEAGHWLELPSQTESLAEGTHELLALLALVESHDGLSDGDWARLYETVSHSLGQPLAVAAARARLLTKVLPSSGSEPLKRQVGETQGAVSHSIPIMTEPTPRSTQRTNVRSSLVLDLAMASLVPSMGTVIHLPSDSPSESEIHRLLRLGRAPQVVEPPSTQAARSGSANQPISARRAGSEWNQVHKGGTEPAIIAGPLSLLNRFGTAPDPKNRTSPFATSQLGSGGSREKTLAMPPA